jgi:hypothetical protein
MLENTYIQAHAVILILLLSQNYIGSDLIHYNFIYIFKHPQILTNLYLQYIHTFG